MMLTMSRPAAPAEMRVAPPLPEASRSGLPAPPVPRTVLLVNPFYPKDPHASFGKHVLAPALALTSLAAATPPGWEVKLWDENLLHGPCPAEPPPSVVGITVHVAFARRSYALAERFRALGATVVLGGLHVTSCPDEAAAHADAVVVGNGVAVWPTLLADLERGALRRRYDGSYRAPFELELEPAPRRDLLPRGAFLTSASVVATRGCHNRCGFCTLATEGLVQPYQTRPPEAVAREIEATGEPYAVFLDNSLGSRPEYLRALCRALAPLGIVWSAAVTVDVTDDPSLVREMALSGCTGVFVGFESLADANLVESRKRTPPADDYARRVGVLHENGIQVNGSFVLGFDHDGPEVFETTVRWIERVRLECATFHVLTPYPGTPLFRRLEAEGRILTRDWDLYDTSHCVFRPARMSPGELEAGYAECYERLFSYRSIWARRPRDLSAVPPYLAMSVLYKKSNPLWRTLIRHGVTAAVWRPVVEASRLRHLRFRERLRRHTAGAGASAAVPVPAGV